MPTDRPPVGPPPGRPVSLSQTQRSALAAALDRVIPVDDYPSATGAGLMNYVDRHAPDGLGPTWPLLVAGLDDLNTEAQFLNPTVLNPTVLNPTVINPTVLNPIASDQRNAKAQPSSTTGFAELSHEQQDEVLSTVQHGAVATT